MSKEEIKLILEALEGADWYINQLEMIVYSADDAGTHENRLKVQQAITVMRLEIDAQNMASKPAQQEPVAWRYTDARGHYRYRGFVANFDKKYPMLKPQPLYTSPIAQQEPFQNNPFDCGVYLGSGKDHVIKHHVSYGPAQQEPVAWTNWRELVGARHYRTPGWEMYADKRNPDDVAIYTSPIAQRKPLTSEEVSDLRIKHGITSNGRGIKEFTQIVDFVRDIETKLKEQP